MESLNWHHRIDEISSDDRTYTRTADVHQRAALAETFNLLSCDNLSATYTLKALERDAIAVKGRLKAQGQQACVVTLEPVLFDVCEDFDVVFQRHAETPAGDEHDELEVSSIQDIETYSGSIIDVGQIIFDHVSAGLDPYPRKMGARFDRDDETERVERTTHPFAALEKLKRDMS